MYVGIQCSVAVRLSVGSAARCSSYLNQTWAQGKAVASARQDKTTCCLTRLRLGKAGQVCWLDKARLWDLTMARQC
ncbi:hypothetical protein R3W88_019281 [Solanum pinnatisectum]|uniref:Secreted protein n=1 Tax=Solanum pinnatisectum TaxID=50273 RepID=A0AAV9KLE3_9SOLN|nr:hypothetical protein R3W88_019281 [Solanum pinnatisectum]